MTDFSKEGSLLSHFRTQENKPPAEAARLKCF